MRARSVLLVVLSVGLAASSWIALAGGAGAATEAKKKKLKCSQGEEAIAEIEPLYDINSNIQNSFEERVGVVQFGNLKVVQDQVKAVDANNPVPDVRAEPQSNITFVDKVSATGDLVITFGGGESRLDQGTQFFMCVGKNQNGTKKGAWRITLYSICNLYQLNPCSDSLVNKALNSLTPGLLELANQ